jgi:hypothetical protein
MMTLMMQSVCPLIPLYNGIWEIPAYNTYGEERMSKEMTPKQRLIAAIARQEIDRPAVMPCLFRWIRGNMGCTCEMHQLAACEKFGFDPLISYGMYLNRPLSGDYVYRPDEGSYRDLPNVDVDIRIENQGDRTFHIRKFETPAGTLDDKIEWALPGRGYGDGPNPHRVEPLVKCMGDVAALKYLYPVYRPEVLADMKLFTEMVGERGLVQYYEGSNAGCWGMESLGPENMLMCAFENKELLHAVLRVCQDQHIQNLKRVLESGHKQIAVSWFQCGPSVGWSPDNIQEFFMPLVKEGVDLVKEYGGTYRYQDDGNMLDLIPQLVEFGVDLISGLQPPPVGDCEMGKLHNEWGDKVAFMGGLDPIYTFERGNRDTVTEAVNELLNQIQGPTGIIVGTAEAFGPETPTECLQALADAVKSFSRPICSVK